MEHALNASHVSKSARIAGFATVALSLVAVAVLTMAGSVSAQDGPGATCVGDNVTTFGTEYYGTEDLGNRLLANATISREFALAAPLPAGTYELDVVSYDGYDNRAVVTGQTREQWYSEFLAADGTVLATSGVTADLEDGVDEATWSGVVGTITIDQEATVVRVLHASPGTVSPNSVRPVCIGATGGPEEPEPEVSDLTVDYDSVDAEAATIVASCGALEESAAGVAVDLAIDLLPAGAECTVTYPADLACAVALTPADIVGVAGGGVTTVQVPAEGGASIVVDIDCVGSEVAAVTTTTAPVTTTTISTNVGGQVETPVAPTAQVQPGNPAFTG